MKSILGSTETRGPKASAKEKTEGSWLKRTTLISVDKPSHDLRAKACLFPTEPAKGLGAAKIVILGPLESVKPRLLKRLMEY